MAAYVQSNFGARSELRIAGIPFGDLDVAHPMGDPAWLVRDAARADGALPGTDSAGTGSTPTPAAPPGGAGSVIALVATDAPLLPAQCAALARRVPLGLARTGTTGSHFSGDIFLAWSTAGMGQLDSGFELTEPRGEDYHHLSFVPWARLDPFYAATVHAVEEAVVNALVAAEDMTGRDGNISYALPHPLVTQRLQAAGAVTRS